MEYDPNDYQGRKKSQVEFSYKVLTFCYSALIIGVILYVIVMQFI